MTLGLKLKDVAQVPQGLARVMADTYLLYLKTQNFHWNATGPMSGELPALYEHVVRRMRALFAPIEEAGDVGSGDIPIRRMQYHTKRDWMLRSDLPRVGHTAKAA